MVFGGMECTHEQGARPCGTGNAAELETARLLQIGVEPPEVARRLKVSRTSVWRWKQAFAANGRSDRGKRSRRGGALRRAPRYLAPAAADRRREEAIGRSARSRRLGARICHRSVDAGAGAKLIAKISSKRYSESGV
ncbi:MAG: helix-turn-helix domain-containing protein [Methylocella sp.]